MLFNFLGHTKHTENATCWWCSASWKLALPGPYQLCLLSSIVLCFTLSEWVREMATATYTATVYKFWGRGTKKFLGIGWNIWVKYWVKYWVQYWVAYWVEYWVKYLGSILGFILGFNIGFNIGFYIGFDIEVQNWVQYRGSILCWILGFNIWVKFWVQFWVQ